MPDAAKKPLSRQAADEQHERRTNSEKNAVIIPCQLVR
jgi:hypothetical protein